MDEIIRGNFSCRGKDDDSFTVNGYARAKPGELRSSLTDQSVAIRTKSNKLGKGSHQKDEAKPLEWYQAQLVHYGLTPYDTVAAAKQHLLDEMGNNDLTVPPHIRELKAQMKAEWIEAQKTKKIGLKKAKQVVERKELQPKEYHARFELSAPSIEENWLYTSQAPLTCIVARSEVDNRLWGTFDLGAVRGVMRSVDPPPQAMDLPSNFTWRGVQVADDAERQTMVGECRVTFRGQGKINGTFFGAPFGVGGAQFNGRRKGLHDMAWADYIPQWKAEFEAYQKAGEEEAEDEQLAVKMSGTKIRVGMQFPYDR